ncbi:uncharacterized protein [Palaemon carinicauda]|uniref:uncharacterized protein n=1 Tax=Palaemon carinicauda TaxID=392227 RepID=UPI0035B57286
MNDGLKLQLTQITNKNKPLLKDIEDNIFEATERYLGVQKRYQEKKVNRKVQSDARSTLSFASNVQVDSSSAVKLKGCILCRDENGSENANHPVNKCKVYASPKAKVERLLKLNACTKCANPHKTSACRFTFLRKCNKCNDWHFSFLCDNNVKVATDNVNKEKGSFLGATNGMISIDCNKVLSHTGASILPTFSVVLSNNEQMRCLKDSGSQLNFIDAEFAKRNNLEVLESNFSVTVRGINSQRNLVTNVVRVNLNNNVNSFCVEAICLPEINTKLILPGLSRIVERFMEKGYKFADKFLAEGEDMISDIKFILGTQSIHCLPEITKLFGSGVPSAYLETSLGIMLSGNVNEYLRNLQSIPHSSNSTRNPSVLLSHSEADSVTIIEPEKDHSPNTECISAEVNYAVLDDKGDLVQSELKKATDAILSEQCSQILNYDKTLYNESCVENDVHLINYVLNSVTRSDDGRLVLPILWNKKVSHLLGKNQTLSKLVLKSNFKRYHKDGKSLGMIDEVFREQESLGIIERVDNLSQFLEEHPSFSFLPHMPVFRFEKESSKCRNVFLSNICENDPSRPLTVSHNQAMLAGPCLNKKVSTTILQLRFDSHVLCFDLKKAFLQIVLPESDQQKLLFYWYRNVAKNDFSLIVYKHVRLPFGLRPSPALLLLALYYILMIDIKNDSLQIRNLKRNIYDLCYMDNCAISFNDPVKLKWAFDNLKQIFEPYGFEVQQFMTNCKSLQSSIDGETGEKSTLVTKLFGLLWNTETDTLSTQKLVLDKNASSKRQILSSIASNFDIFNFCGPLLNRARIFMHSLQCNKEIGWDNRLSEDLLREWNNIAKQLNSSPMISVNRFVGRRDMYNLIAYTDSSRSIYGCVVFLYNLRTKKTNFVMAKNRFVNKQLESKSIPSLEFQAVSLGTQVLHDIRRELSGSNCVEPINIVGMDLYTDSLVCLHWLSAHVTNFDKLRNLSIFVKNRLDSICRMCEEFPIKFKFCAGSKNPADAITRPLSYKQLMNSNFFSGTVADADIDVFASDMMEVTIPNTLLREEGISSSLESSNVHVATESVVGEDINHLVSMDSFSGFKSIVSVHRYVIRFINNLKIAVKMRDPSKYSHFNCLTDETLSEAYNFVIYRDQQIHFPEVFKYFARSCNAVREIPNIISQLNIYPDHNGILRVRSKTARWKDRDKFMFSPILLSKDSALTKKLILEMHKMTNHAGIYSLLTEFRKTFWVSHFF